MIARQGLWDGFGLRYLWVVKIAAHVFVDGLAMMEVVYAEVVASWRHTCGREAGGGGGEEEEEG
jgi:hypothetical protein